MTREIELFFDVISPYAYLALTQAPSFAAELGIHFRYRPVAYGVLLDHNDLVGPAESPAKRRYTMIDIQRCAHLLAVPVLGPPAHPFRSLEALRTVCLFEDDRRAGALAVALARAAWAQGRDLTDPAVRASVVSAVDLDPTDLEDRIAAPAIKRRLQHHTDDALEAGVFGVPTFLDRATGALFWGHDRMPQLALHLRGELPAPINLAAVLARPRGVDRPGRPGRGS